MEFKQSLRILFVEDNPLDAELAQRELKKERINFSFTLVDNENDFIKALDEYDPDIIISDYSMPNFDGMSALHITRSYKKNIPFIILTGSINEETAVKCMKAGANDYVLKDKIKRLPFSLKEAIKNQQAEQDKIEMRDQLRENEFRYRELVDTINSGVAIYQVKNEGKTGNDYIIQSFNRAALEMEKLSKDQVVGRSLKDLRPNIDEYGLIEIFHHVWETGEAAFYPAKIYVDNNFSNYYENHVFRLPNMEIVAIYDDVTEKEQALHKIKESEKRFELAMQASRDGLYDWDLITNEIYYSPGWKKMLGYEYHELPNDFSVWETLTEPEDVKKSWEMLEKVKNKELDRFETEYKMKHKNGQWIDIFVRAEAIFDENGKAVRMIGTHVDISDRKKAENQLKQALKKAQESDSLKSAFLANMSHEIRTPMNGILGFSSLLKQANLNNTKQREYIEIIERSGKRMLNTINDLIDISRIESGQVNIIKTQINFNQQLNYLYNFFKPEADEKALSFTYEPTIEDNEAFIFTDEEKFAAIISNFLKNAIKYTPEGHVQFGYHNIDNCIEFYVRDSGIGIPADKHNAIFERFVQADLSITKPYEGSGLGLAICKAYAEMIDGKIRVKSQLNEGAIFYLTLPFNENKKQSIETKEKLASKQKAIFELKHLNILVVEDDEASSLYMKIILENQCNQLHFADTGRAAIDFTKNHPEIDLILMDIRMPDIDGLTATQKIREFNKDVLIVAQTAYAMESDRQKAIDAGCNDYIQKPVQEEKLLELIESLLRD
jgi:hypothetical protein